MRHSILIATTVSDYGPFAPHVGYVISIVSTVAMIGFLVRGPLHDWDIPDNGFPKLLGRVIGFLGAAVMVAGWFLASPVSVTWICMTAVLFLLIAAYFSVRYVLLIPMHKFEKEVANPDGKTTRKEPLLGGDTLTAFAQNVKTAEGYTEQEMLARVAYDADRIWPREARVRVMQRFALCYILALTLGAGGVSWLAFSVQVKLTGKPATAVIRSEDATGVENVEIPPSS